MTTIGQRLKYARETAGLTLQQVHQRTGLGSSSLSEWENDVREPSFSQLSKLAVVYHRDSGFFLETDALPHDTVLWRERPENEAAADIEVRLIRLAEQFHRLEQLCGNPVLCQLTQATGTAAQFSYPDAEKLAHDFRKQHSLGERPAASLMSVLEEVCRVKVFHHEFEPSGTAACIRSDRFGSAVLLNSNNIRWRRNFDLAHELFHLLTWHVFRNVDSANQSSKEEERLANKFASCLLMPAEPLKLAIDAQRGKNKTLDYDDLFEIARQFDVSALALIWRMVDTRLIEREKAKETIESIRGRVELWEKRRNETPPKRPIRFEALALEAVEKGLLSTGKFAQFMDISRLAAMRRIEQEVHSFSQGNARAEVELIDS